MEDLSSIVLFSVYGIRKPEERIHVIALEAMTVNPKSSVPYIDMFNITVLCEFMRPST